MVTKFPIDYMHLICLGIVKKIINIWTSGPLHVRIGATVSLISDGIMTLSPICLDNLLGRDVNWLKLNDGKRPSSELSCYIQGKLSDILYKKCMMLFAGVTILYNINLYEQYCDYVKDCLAPLLNILKHCMVKR